MYSFLLTKEKSYFEDGISIQIRRNERISREIYFSKENDELFFAISDNDINIPYSSEKMEVSENFLEKFLILWEFFLISVVFIEPKQALAQ